MDPSLGEIKMFGGNFVPQGWVFCNGQLLSIQQYPALFSLLGRSFGGDGITNFGLPNLQGRMPMHWGTGQGLSSRTLGQMSGSETVTLQTSQIPAHSHILAANTGGGNQTTANNTYIAETVDEGGTGLNAFASTSNTAMNPGSIGNTGGNQPHDNMSPFQCVTFIIALNGIYPQRP